MAYFDSFFVVLVGALALSACSDKHGDDDSGGTAGDPSGGMGALGGSAGRGSGGSDQAGASGMAGRASGDAGRQGAAGTGSGSAGRSSGTGGAGGASDTGGASGDMGGTGETSGDGGTAGQGAGTGGTLIVGGFGGRASGGGQGGAGGSAGTSSAPPPECTIICDWEDACTSSSNCATDCAPEFRTNQACSDSAVAFAGCITEANAVCDDVLSGCDTQFGAYKNNCENVGVGADSCPFAQDGTCDEPGFCDPGTDTTDCGDSNSCVLAFDGTCQEPTDCAPGTDRYDCS